MNLFKNTALLFLASTALVSASNVIVADDKNFKELVVDAGVPSLVEIYASWCGHCKKLAPIWEQLADSYAVDPKKGGKPKVQIVKIDGDINRKVSKNYGVTGFPTLKFFNTDGSVEDVNVGRDFASLSEFVNKKSGAVAKVAKKEPSAIVQLTDDTFDKIVYDPKKTVIVAYTASWCGHCKSLKPEYAKVASVFRNDDSVVVAEVDTTGEGTDGLKGRFNVKGYPTILVFPAVEDLEDLEEPEKYTGARKVEAIVAFLNEASGLHRNVDGSLGETAGRVQILDAIAHQFVDASEDIRVNLLSKINAIAEDSAAKVASSAKIYKRFADKISVGSVEYLNKEIKRLSSIISKGALKSTKLDELQIKLNILKAYVPGQAVIEEKGNEAAATVSKVIDQHGDKPKQDIIKDEF